VVLMQGTVVTLTEEVQSAVLTHAERVIPAIEKVAPQHSGILPSEMLAFIAVCLSRGVQTIVESGRKQGVSTEILSNLDWHVTSIDNNPVPEADALLAGRDNLTLLKGDGYNFVSSHKPTATAGLLLDGPKGPPAYNLVQSVRDRYAVVAIHDAHPGSQLRELVKDRWYLTDNPWLIDRYGYLDLPHLKHCGFNSHSALLGEANCLAIL
jgi:hypothetical protein